LVGAGDIDMVLFVRTGQTKSTITPDMSQSTSEALKTGRTAGPWWSGMTARASYAMTMKTISDKHGMQLT